MKIYKYKDYEEYKSYQIRANKLKLDKVWVEEGAIKLICKKLQKENIPIDFGICHGTRRGQEQKWFKKYLRISTEILGTEISPTAKTFANTIEWDFHNVKDDWIRNCDFIYSNSIDHSYNPTYCLSQWLKCLNETGYCILHWWKKSHDLNPTKFDPFKGSIKEYIKLIPYNFHLEEIIEYSSKLKSNQKILFIKRRQWKI